MKQVTGSAKKRDFKRQSNQFNNRDDISCGSGDLDSSQKNPGLKIISRQVMSVVARNVNTTYKDVANVVSGQNADNPEIMD